MRKVLSIVTLASVLLFTVSAMAHDKVVVIPLNTRSVAATVTDTKLWGESRVGTTVTFMGSVNGIDMGRSSDLVSWDGAAAACPQDTWVCSYTDIQGLIPTTGFGSVSIISCAGVSGTSDEAWLNDTMNNTQGKTSRPYYKISIPGVLEGWVMSTNSKNKCQYLPAYCCSTAN